MAGGGHLELELGAWLDTSLLLLEITVLRTAARDTWGRGQAQGTALSALELGQASGCFPPELTPIVSQNMEPAPQGVRGALQPRGLGAAGASSQAATGACPDWWGGCPG